MAQKLYAGFVRSQWSRSDGGSLSSGQSSAPLMIVQSSEYKNSVVTPGYWALKQTGAHLPDNGFEFYTASSSMGTVVMSKYHESSRGPDLDPDWYRETRSYPISWTVPLPMPQPTLPTGPLKAMLMGRARSSRVSLPVALAEFGKTAELVVNSANRLASMLYQLRRGSLQGFVDLFHDSARRIDKTVYTRFSREYKQDRLRAVSTYWLEYSYGWIPFLSEVRSAVNTTLDIMDLPESRTGHVRARMRRQYNESSVVDVEVSPRMRARRTALINEELRGQFRFVIKPDSIPARFGLTNPYEVVWELVPLSFVADWFLPIGDYLADLDAGVSFEFLSGTYGSRVKVSEHYSCFVDTDDWDTASGHMSQEAVLVRRIPMVDLPVQDITDILVRPEMSLRRVVSSLALLKANLRGLRL